MYYKVKINAILLNSHNFGTYCFVVTGNKTKCDMIDGLLSFGEIHCLPVPR